MAQLFKGRIRLKKSSYPITVSAEANSPSTAKKIIEAQYSGQIRSWDKHLASN